MAKKPSAGPVENHVKVIYFGKEVVVPPWGYIAWNKDGGLYWYSTHPVKVYDGWLGRFHGAHKYLGHTDKTDTEGFSHLNWELTCNLVRELMELEVAPQHSQQIVHGYQDAT